MELQWIDDFLALCHTRNFTRAAENRCTTQSAYSRRIQRLEEWLGSSLFYRESRPVGLTPAGEEFLVRAVRLREDIFDARRAVLSASSHFKKNLRIYTTNTLAGSFLSTWLIENRLENYSLIVASIAGCVEAIKRKHADLALIPHFGTQSDFIGLQAEAVGDDCLTLVTGQTQKRAVVLNKNRLCGPLMVYTPGTTYGARIAAMLDAHHIQIIESPVCESASAEALLAQVKAGLGAAWIPGILLEGNAVKRCAVPAFCDIPYKIFLIKAQRES
ncbi:MAG: LysR family transcriptional regulator [Alphaproteobacteria bacterium]|nr:LysR family transcriptional regulator [Alphaproteobacteria bacterium]